MNLDTRKVNINEICNVERAITGKMYKAGTCFIKLSAADETVGQISKMGGIDQRYAIFEPKDEVDTAYLFIAIERCFPAFLRRYRTTINLQFGALKNFVIDWHDDQEAQKYVVDVVGTLNNEIEMTEQQIKLEKEQKRWYLNKMMI